MSIGNLNHIIWEGEDLGKELPTQLSNPFFWISGRKTVTQFRLKYPQGWGTHHSHGSSLPCWRLPTSSCSYLLGTCDEIYIADPWTTAGIRGAGPLHSQTSTYKLQSALCIGIIRFNQLWSCSTVAFTIEKYSCISGPAQFKLLLFKGQLCCQRILMPAMMVMTAELDYSLEDFKL